MRTLRRGVWPLLVVLVATIPVAGLFTFSNIFFVRDLAIAFRSRFLFLRHSVLSGSVPLWDPYPANGQPAVNDPLYQLFHLPSLAIRLLLPEIVAYNLWVALPIPLCALGMYLFLRRHVSPPASAFGAIAFAVSGPIVSTTNFPNLSWSVAAVPYVFWALERVFERRSARATALLAVIVSCQALAGEPVTLAATLAIAAAYAVTVDGRWRDIRGVSLVALGSGAGLLLSAIQYVPMVAAGRASLRSTMAPSDFWAFHPLALFELLVPHFFGDYFHSNLREVAWMVALNSDRDPFYYTMYVGVPVLLLAAVAMLSGRPRTRFWTVVIVACALAALGPHTPLYPALQALVPPLRTFRFPVKYLSLASLGLATLASLALQSLLDGDVPRRAVRVVLIGAGAGALVTYLAIAWVLLAPQLPIRAFFHLAVWAKVPSPIQGAEFLLFRARPLLTSLLLKLLAATFLLGVAASARRERQLALAVLCAFAVVDLLASNGSVNPTLDASMLADPEWLQHVPRDMHERVYIGGRLEGYVNVFDVDAPKYATYPDDRYTQMEQRHMLVAQLLFNPSGARVRESLSYDLPLLWPLDFARAVGRFKYAPREDRLRYLARVGTRFAILPTPPFPGATPLARLAGTEQLQLYDINPQARRLYIVGDALMGPDVTWQIEGLFQPRFDPSKGVLVSEPPPPAAGRPGPSVAPSATFVEDGLNRVVIRAGLAADGYLALLDTYNPDWKVDVDGAPAPLMRANGLFRAVHLTPGEHVVTFTYRPRKFYLGAAITALTALGLTLWSAWGARGARRARGAHGA
jgi:Bacterial membrane protein YfhO